MRINKTHYLVMDFSKLSRQTIGGSS